MVDRREALAMVELVFVEKRREDFIGCEVWFVLVEEKTCLGD